MYGTILFSFSFVSAIPNWINENEIYDQNQKNALHYSSILGSVFKILFGLTLAYTTTFGAEFNLNDYFQGIKNFEGEMVGSSMVLICYVEIIMGLFLTFTLMNGIVNHIELMYLYAKSNGKDHYNIFVLIFSIFVPWFMSLLLLVNGRVFLNFLNWSSIFLFGYVNFILPLLLYIEAVNEAENFENNFKQSAILDFEVIFLILISILT